MIIVPGPKSLKTATALMAHPLGQGDGHASVMKKFVPKKCSKLQQNWYLGRVEYLGQLFSHAWQ